MAVVENQVAGSVVLWNVSWSTYEAILADTDRSGTRLTYNQGSLEIMSPSEEHERLKKLIGRMVETLTEELGIPIRSAGSTTWKMELKRQGLEPDECYYITNEPLVRGKNKADLAVDPPPDLAVEVELTRRAVDKMPIYANLGVPEVWRYDGKTICIERLQADGNYVSQPQSGAFPFLPMAELVRFLDRRNATDETSWIRSFRAWVRTLETGSAETP
ncbi:MAG: Uma2 family endonuclease [Candidatus Nealsonbacteria bacterium]|nr:Uma2 family endonuclease [Candidatus Nealsonbacteria bacterium]